MEIKPIAASLVAEFAARHSVAAGLFLQTPSWLKFQIAVGRSGEHLGFYHQQELIGVATVIFHAKYGRWRYAYLPKGPLAKTDYLSEILVALKNYYLSRSFIYLRVEPPLRVDELSAIPTGYLKVADVQPGSTSWLDLNYSEAELLKQMHPKTRYNIRLAQKKDLTWELVGAGGLDDFWRLVQITARRDGFKPWPYQHYEKMVELFSTAKLAGSELAVRIAQVKYNGQVLAASLLVFSSGIVTYLVGGSTNEHRALMPNYFLHWQSIKEAKRLGYKYYDWWGVALTGSKQQAWRGITRFKLGWGGRVVSQAGTYDWVYKKWKYEIYKMVGRIRRMI